MMFNDQVPKSIEDDQEVSIRGHTIEVGDVLVKKFSASCS
jgi:hypothetical protein